MSPKDPWALTRLGLRGAASEAARELVAQHPDVEFTSGKRTREEQANAMAENIVKAGRTWIKDTYKDSKVSRVLQKWIDDRPKAKSKTAISGLLLAAMSLFSDDELSSLSCHFTGDAFDVKPIAGLQGTMVLLTLKSLCQKHGGTLITKEGGVVVWHAQFKKK